MPSVGKVANTVQRNVQVLTLAAMPAAVANVKVSGVVSLACSNFC